MKKQPTKTVAGNKRSDVEDPTKSTSTNKSNGPSEKEKEKDGALFFKRRLVPYEPDPRRQASLAARAKRLLFDRDNLRAAIMRIQSFIGEDAGSSLKITAAPEIRINKNTVLTSKDVGRLEIVISGLEREVSRLTDELEKRLVIFQHVQQTGSPLPAPLPTRITDNRPKFELPQSPVLSQSNGAGGATFSGSSTASESASPNPPPPTPPAPPTSSPLELNSVAEILNAGADKLRSSRSRSSRSSKCSSRRSRSSSSSSGSSSISNSRSTSESRSRSRGSDGGSTAVKNFILDRVGNVGKPLLHEDLVTTSPMSSIRVDDRLKRVGHWPQFTVAETRHSNERIHPQRLAFAPRQPVKDIAPLLMRVQSSAAEKYKKEYHQQSFSKERTKSVDSAARLWREQAKILGIGQIAGSHSAAPKSQLVAAIYGLTPAQVQSLK